EDNGLFTHLYNCLILFQLEEFRVRFSFISQCKVIRNINTYARTKTLAQGFLDMALFTANASQMKHLLQQGPDTQFYYFLFVCLGISIGLQLIVAALLIYKASKNIECDDPEVHLLNNIVTGLILVITAVNVFITAFWFTSPPLTATDPKFMPVTPADNVALNAEY
uniref:Ninjurin-1-like n=1 Tax=Scleropages formosus TaxID=113540 RepID=A0A8C9TJ53_SCLFO